MPRLVHLAPRSVERRIDRGGLRGAMCKFVVDGAEHQIEEGVFAMPVVPDFLVTHQWLRELRRWNRERLIAVYFSVPSSELVYAGRYGREKRHGSIGKLLPAILRRPQGAEVVVPRRILRTEIHKMVPMRQDIGWVENPDTAHKYDCVCIMCLPPGMARLKRRLRRAYQAAIAEARSATTGEAMCRALQGVNLPLERARGNLPAEPLLAFSTHPDLYVRRVAIGNLEYLRTPAVEARVVACLADAEVAEAALESLIGLVGAWRAFSIVESEAPHLVRALIGQLEYRADSASLSVLRELASHPDQAVAKLARAALEENED